jgi:hypothetical protein
MWLNTTMHYGLRGRQEHVSMLWGDVVLHQNPNGVEYLEFNKRTTKTRQGTSKAVRAFQPKIYSTGNKNFITPLNSVLIIGRYYPGMSYIAQNRR